MILGPRAWNTIVAPTVNDGSCMERANCFLIWCSKGYVRLCWWTVVLSDPEEWLAGLAIARGMVAIIVYALNAQRAKRLIVKVT